MTLLMEKKFLENASVAKSWSSSVTPCVPTVPSL